MRITSLAALAAAVGSAIAAPLSDVTLRQVGSTGTSDAPQEPSIPKPEVPTTPENLKSPPRPDNPEILPLPQTPEAPQLSGPDGSAPGVQLPNATSPAATPIAQKFLFSDIFKLILDKLPELIEAAQALKPNDTTSGYSVTTATIAKKRSGSPRQVGAVDAPGSVQNLPALLQALEAAKGDVPGTGDQGNSTGVASSLTSRQAVDVAGIIEKLPALVEALEAAKSGVPSPIDQGNTTAAMPSIASRQTKPVDVPALLAALVAAQGEASDIVDQSNTTAMASPIVSRQVSPAELAATLQQLPEIIDSIESKKGNYTNAPLSKKVAANAEASA